MYTIMFYGFRDAHESILNKLYVLNQALSVLVNSFTEPTSPDDTFKPQPRKITLEPAIESLAKLLALTVDHVDTLLEDWYPSIGTRFVHTSEGKYLVTRLIPCPRCYPGDSGMYNNNNDVGNLSGFGGKSPIPGVGSSEYSGSSGGKLDALKGFGFSNRSPRMSSDSGVGHSPGNTRVSSVDSVDSREVGGNNGGNGGGGDEATPGAILFKTGNRAGALGFESSSRYGGGVLLGDSSSFSASNFTGLNFFLKGGAGLGPMSKRNLTMYSWSVEYCILHSQKQAEFCTQGMLQQDQKKAGLQQSASRDDVTCGDVKKMSVKCPKHGDISLEEIAPDILFLDLNFRFLLKNSEVQRGNLLGNFYIFVLLGTSKLLVGYFTLKSQVSYLTLVFKFLFV